MSGWTTTTLELCDESTYYANNDSYVFDDAQEALHEHDMQVYSAASLTGRYNEETGTNHMCLMAVIGGHHGWDNDLELLEDLREYSNGRAVIIHANDTSDSGVARL